MFRKFDQVFFIDRWISDFWSMIVEMLDLIWNVRAIDWWDISNSFFISSTITI